MKKEAWFGISIMALVVVGVLWFMPPFAMWTNGHLGLLMLAMIVIAIMLGFPTALARAAAPWLMGLLWSTQWGYRWGLLCMCGLGVVAVACMWMAQQTAPRAVR